MYCPNCNKHYDDGKFCPECGARLVDDPKPEQEGFHVDLGDANAFAGDVTLNNQHTDSHNHIESHTTDSHNVDNRVINTDSHNVVNNIVQERQKTDAEILQEKKQEFTRQVQDFYADGILSEDENRQLEELRIHLGLDKKIAQNIISEMSTLKRDTGVLSRMDSMTLQRVIELIGRNDVDRLKREIRRLEAMARRTGVEEVRFYYYLLLAALDPTKCITIYENSVDNYWRTYWTSMAYIKLGQIEKATETIENKLQMWNGNYPEENAFLLQAVSLLIDYANSKDDYIKEQIDTFLKACYDMHTSFLDDFLQSISDVKNEIETGESNNNEDFSAFYKENLLSCITIHKDQSENTNVPSEEVDEIPTSDKNGVGNEPIEEEAKMFDVVIDSAKNLLSAMVYLRNKEGWDAGKSKQYIKSLPSSIKTFREKDEAEGLLKQLLSNGFIAHIEEIQELPTKTVMKETLPQKESLFTVKMVSSGKGKLIIMKILMDSLHIDISKAKKMVFTDNSLVMQHANKEQAETLYRKLQEKGANVIIEQE